MQVSGGTGLLITIYCRVRVSGILLNMFMRNKNQPFADSITKNVLEYIMTRYNVTAGDIGAIRTIIHRSVNANRKKWNLDSVKPLPEPKKKTDKK